MPLPDFETLEEAHQQYLDLAESHEGARFLMADLSRRVQDRMGRAGLISLAQVTHRKKSTLEQEARVARLADLRSDRPTLTFTHFAVVCRMAREEAVKWLELASSDDWSPAELRRKIADAHRQPEGPDVVLKKADSSAERFKGVVDQAASVGVLRDVREKAEGVVAYAQAQERKTGDAYRSEDLPQ